MENFKLLHTADWHIGLTLEKQSMKDEHDSFMGQLIDMVKNEQPDALLVSGDVFDTSNPSNDVHNWLIDQLKLLHLACPAMHIVVTAGNHDSANRLLIGHQLTSLINTHLVGRLALTEERNADYAGQVIHLTDADGQTKALVAAVPFVNRLSYPLASETETDHESRKKAFYAGLDQHMSQHTGLDIPLLLMAHLTIANAGCSDEPSEVGNIESADASILGENFDYIALGHLHHPHHCDGHDGRINYSGSPIGVSFDEDFQHSVALVEFQGRKIVRQERLPLQQKHRLVTFPQQKCKEARFATFEDAMQLLAEYDGADDYIRLNIFSKGLPTNFRAQAAKAAEDKGCKLLKINYKHEDTYTQTENKAYSFDEFKSLSPYELALRYLAESGNDISTEAKDKLKDCIDQTLEEKRNNN